ncbi:MAG: MraY family glycosyltransferase, partial [Eggerthellaceae bacterium]|nr:MraY family glycosyltransferase [Eggerthellaceae bacterium]
MEWYQLAVVFVVAFAVTFACVPLSKRIARLVGAIDYPSNRRVNTAPIPRCGGIALYLGLVAGALSIYIGVLFFGWKLNDLYILDGVNYLLLFVGISVMFAVGLFDDITQISPLAKFGGQVVAAIIVVFAGVSIGAVRTVIAGDYVDLGWFDYPLTVLYLVVFANVTNLIDGLDGLASGVVAIVSMALMYLVFMRGSVTLLLMCLATIAVCLAFLRYNFFPASIFMGDSGSLLLGFVVGIISVAGIVRTQSFVIMLVPLAIAGVPVLDTFTAIVRRLRGHESIGHADLEHVHHRLLQAGLSQRRSVLVLWLCSAVLAAVGCAISGMSGLGRWIIFLVLAAAIFVVIWKVGLFKTVLAHHYAGQGGRGPRLPRE